MLAKINLSVSLLRDFDEGCAHEKVDARGSFSRGPRNFDADENDVTESAALRQAGIYHM